MQIIFLTPVRIRERMVVRMSKYTTEVRYICEMNSGFPVDEMQDHTPDEIISASRTKIFDFSYPIYETAHKPELETKILKHYYTREIGAETVGLWKLWLNDTLNLIMPKYNKLYQAEAAVLEKELNNIDVEHYSLRDDDFTRTDNLHHTNNQTRTDNLHEATAGTDLSKDQYSDTPQGTITNVDNNSYLTDYRRIDGTNSGTRDNTGTQTTAGTGSDTGTQKNTGTQELTGWERGYRGGKIYAELMADYAEKILNIDMMIVRDLGDMFFKLW